MGFNSGVLILHDALNEIRDYPAQFADNLAKIILSNPSQSDLRERPISFGVGMHGNAAALFHCAHADEHRGFILGGNTAWAIPGIPIICRTSMEKEDMYLRQLNNLADVLGYRLVKKKNAPLDPRLK